MGATEEVVLHLQGEIDFANIADLRSAVRRLATEAGSPIVIDCAELRFIDAAGLRVLAELVAQTIEQDRVAVVRHASPFQLRLLRLANLDHRFQIDPAAPARKHGARG
jgi:anti-anti-sigma factor